jgi:hypothetical protein
VRVKVVSSGTLEGGEGRETLMTTEGKQEQRRSRRRKAILVRELKKEETQSQPKQVR